MKLKFVFILALTCSLHSIAQNWLTDFEKAKQIAKEKNENIVLVFQGSDWCAPCIKLDREIWSTNEFQKLAKDHLVMVKADFPRKKDNKLPQDLQIQNDKLAEHYNTQGFFPLVVLLDGKGNVLGEMGYEKLTPTAYFNKLTALKK